MAESRTRLLAALCAGALAAVALAQPVLANPAASGYTVSTQGGVPAPPGRAGRLADFSGSVWIYEQDRGEWIEALRNRPLTTGDRVSTGSDARAEVRVGSTTLRIGARTELEVQTLDDHRFVVHLHTGSVAVRLRTRDWAEQLELNTPEVRLKPLQAGHYRLDRFDDVSFAGAWRGELLVDEASSFPITTGQRMEFWRERGLRQHRWATLPADALQAWTLGEDQREERTAYSRHVSPEMTGAEDLDRHGRWDRVPEYGVIWFPWQVTIGWAPYLFGKWVWVRHWGWVWVDNQPWGFAPFHYGRWVQWRGQWGWVPGVYAPRPVFAPAPRPPHEGRPVPPPPRPVHPIHPVHPVHPRPAHPIHPQPVYPPHPGKPEARPPHRPAMPVGEPGSPRDGPPVLQPVEPRVAPHPERLDRGDRPDRHDRLERMERFERSERDERLRPDRVDRTLRPEPRERGAATPQPVTLPPVYSAVPRAEPPKPAAAPRPEVREEVRKRPPEQRPDRSERDDKGGRAERGERQPSR